MSLDFRYCASFSRLSMKLILLNIIIWTLFSCSENSNVGSVPEIFRTNYEKYKDKKFELQFGDLVQIHNTKFKGIICDISEDEGGKWYGIIFMDSQERLFGRNIPSGFSNDCIKLFDFTYLNQNGINSITKISNIRLDNSKIGIGSRSPATNKQELIRDYSNGIKKRKHKETPCIEKIKILDPINENYRVLDEIKLQ